MGFRVSRGCPSVKSGKVVIAVRRFELIIDELPITRAGVRSGKNSDEVVMVARCVNLALFLSHTLRRNVTFEVVIAGDDEYRSISFPGTGLKRVSPDERSIAHFLLKAVNNLDTMAQSKKTLSNGIVLRRGRAHQLMDGWQMGRVFLAGPTGDWQRVQPDGTYIYDMTNTGVIESLLEQGHEIVPMPPRPERFILEVNSYIDDLKNKHMRKSS